MTDAGLIVLVSFISPFRAERDMARGLFADGEFIEIFVDTPLAVAEQRDVKGLYAKARAGRIDNFNALGPASAPHLAPDPAPATPTERSERVTPGGQSGKAQGREGVGQ